MKEKTYKYFKIAIIIITIIFIINGFLFVIIPRLFEYFIYRTNNETALSALTSQNPRIEQCLNNVIKKADNKCIDVKKTKIRQTIFIPGRFDLAHQTQNLIIIDKWSIPQLSDQELEIIIAHELGHLMMHSGALNSHPLSKIINNFDKETTADIISAFLYGKENLIRLRLKFAQEDNREEIDKRIKLIENLNIPDINYWPDESKKPIAKIDNFIINFEKDFKEVMQLARQKCFQFQTPKIIIVIDDYQNAFAESDGASTRIIINSGLLKIYTEKEVKIVIAHELGHLLLNTQEIKKHPIYPLVKDQMWSQTAADAVAAIIFGKKEVLIILTKFGASNWRIDGLSKLNIPENIKCDVEC